MKLNKGTTLVELMVVVVLGGMMLLAASTITDIGKQSHKKLLGEADIYNSITYGFKLIQNRTRESSVMPSSFSAASPWTGIERLEVGNEAFGIYDETGATKSFVYLPDKGDINNRQIIFSVLDGDTLDMDIVFIDLEEPDPALREKEVPANVGDPVKITLNWTKNNGILFSMTTTVASRRL